MSRDVRLLRVIQSGISLAGLAGFLAGCVAPIQYDTAVPQGVAADYTHEIHGDIITIDLAQLSLSAQVQAIDWSGQRLPPPLAVWLSYKSHADGVTLDARQVLLQIDDNEPLRALSYLGPSIAWFSPRALAAGCGPRTYQTGMGLTRSGISRSAVLGADLSQGVYRPTDYPLALTGEGCFMFWYDTDTHPGHAFTLSIDGLVMGGEALQVLAIRFEKGTVTAVGGFP